MANLDNRTDHLRVDDIYSEKGFTQDNDTFGDILNHQKEMQEQTYGFKYEDMSIYDIAQFWLGNKHAEDDETNEMFDALGGINDGIGNGAWKWWKKSNQKGKEMKVSDLSERDKKELYMEFVDKLHFFMNFAASIGLDSKTIYNYYFTKAMENKDRQVRSGQYTDL